MVLTLPVIMKSCKFNTFVSALVGIVRNLLKNHIENVLNTYIQFLTRFATYFKEQESIKKYLTKCMGVALNHLVGHV
jgi:hypothetical protein